MWISKIKLSNFRNYRFQEIELNKNINIFYGEMLREKPTLLKLFLWQV